MSFFSLPRLKHCAAWPLALTIASFLAILSAPSHAERSASFLPPTVITPQQHNPPTAQVGISPITSTTPLISPSVQSAQLDTINPESVGIMTAAEASLSPSLWQGTSYQHLATLLAFLPDTITSPSLNSLQKRILLAQVPIPMNEGYKGTSISSLRISRLLLLGDVHSAGNLANEIMKSAPTAVDEPTHRQLAEAMLVTPQAQNLCTKLPDLLKQYNDPAWQKLLVVCQLQAGDSKAAQLTLDLLHSSNMVDDVFFTLAEKNILAGKPTLPRQITPLTPINLALLQLTKTPLPNEVFAKPSAALVTPLLTTPAQDKQHVFTLVERSISQGIVDSTELAAFFRSLTFSSEELAAPPSVSAESKMQHVALLYQAALQEKEPAHKIALARQALSLTSPTTLPTIAPILAEMLGGVVPSTDFYADSPDILLIALLAHKTDLAQEWLKLAKRGAIGMPAVANDLQKLWPLLVISGIDPTQTTASAISNWFTNFKNSANGDIHTVISEKAVNLIIILDAVGIEIPDEIWINILEKPRYEKTITPQPLYTRLWHQARDAQRQGLSLLYGFIVFGSDQLQNTTSQAIIDTSLFVKKIDTIRSLHELNLTQDANILAIETILPLLYTTTPTGTK